MVNCDDDFALGMAACNWSLTHAINKSFLRVQQTKAWGDS